jgi:hypothetical protein
MSLVRMAQTKSQLPKYFVGENNYLITRSLQQKTPKQMAKGNIAVLG